MGATRNTGYLENLIAYDASNNVAIATTAIDNAFKITMGGSVKMTGALSGTSATFTSSTYPNLITNRSQTSSGSGSATWAALQVKVTTTEQMSAGFGVAQEFVLRDADNTDNINAQFLVQRDGADNSGKFILQTASSGTLGDRLTISSTGAATFSSSIAATSATFSSALSELNVISTGASNIGSITIQGGEGANAQLTLQADDADNASDITILRQADGGTFSIITNNGGVNALQIAATTGAATFSANVGIGGVSLVSWYTGYSAMQIGASASIFGNKTTSDTNTTQIANNAYLNTGATAWVYINSDDATRYEQVNGEHKFYTAASGTAGNNISWSTPLSISSTGAATFSGNVGIGEAARTTSTLVINNTNAKNELTFGGSEYTNIYSETTSGMQFGIVSSGNSAAIEFLTNNAERMRITSGGNVGIGTTSPNRLLEVATSGDTYLRVTGNRGNADDLHVGNVEFYNSNTTRIIAEVRAITGTGGTQSNSGQLAFYTNNAGTYAERMRITSGGNVIIGNTTAYGGLTISDFTANDGNDSLSFFYKGTAGGHQSLIKFYDFRGQLNAAIGNGLEDDGIGTQKASLVFKTSNNATPAERMRITSGGNVTIGTAGVPSGATEFTNGSLFTSNNIFVNNSSGTSGYAVRIDGYANNLYILWSNASGVDQGGVGLAYGGTSWSPVSSDARTKKNFETSQGLAEVLQIEPIKYHLLTDDDNATKRLGFKAQNIQPLIPEMVIPTGKKAEDDSDILTIIPDYILPVLVKAIQEQQEMIEELKNKLA